MSVGPALRAGVGDFYRQSWRLGLLNACVAVALATVVAATALVRAALLLAVFLGPLAAMLEHSSLTLLRTDELRLGDAIAGLRATWRRGIVLGAGVVGAVLLGVVAVPFYVGLGVWGWPPAALTVYLVTMFLVLQLALWPVAVRDTDAPLRGALRDAIMIVVARPLGFLALAGALLLVNALGLLLGILPFFLLTIAYSFLVSTRFALPYSEPEADSWRVSPTIT